MAKSDIVKICYRGIGLFGTNRPIGPIAHPFILDWDNIFHELTNNNGIIKIVSGNIDNMSPVTQYCFNRNTRITKFKEYLVNIDKFFEAIDEFKVRYEGQKFSMFTFNKNCLGFKNFVMRRSLVN